MSGRNKDANGKPKVDKHKHTVVADGLIQHVRAILQQARTKTYTVANSVMIEAYWKIGQRIVAKEQAVSDGVGQMDMYVRMFDDLKRGEGDNPTLGIILCSDKDDTVVRYFMLSESPQLFASKYRLVLPSEEELATELERRHILELPG